MLITSIHFNEIPAEKFATFADACAAGETLNKTIVVSSTLAVEADLTVDRSLVIKPGGRLTIAPGVTLTINGPFQAGLRQCFDGDGSISFAAGTTDKVQAAWFGPISSAAISKAASAVFAGGVVDIGDAGTVNLSASIPINKAMTIRLGTTELVANLASQLFLVKASDVTFLGKSKGVSKLENTNTATGNIIQWGSSGESHQYDNLTVKNIGFTVPLITNAIDTYRTKMGAIVAMAESLNTITENNNLLVEHCEFNEGADCISLEQVYNAKIQHNVFNNTKGRGVLFWNCDDYNLFDNDYNDTAGTSINFNESFHTGSLAKGCDDGQILFNRVNGTGYEAIAVRGARTKCYGNTVNNAKGTGIAVSNADSLVNVTYDCTVEENIVNCIGGGVGEFGINVTKFLTYPTPTKIRIRSNNVKCSADASSCLVLGSGVTDVSLSDNTWEFTGTTASIDCASFSACNGIKLNGDKFVGTKRYSLYLNGGSNIKINAGSFDNQNTSGSTHGIRATSVVGLSVGGSTIKNCNNYGLLIEVASYKLNIDAASNIFENCTSGDIANNTFAFLGNLSAINSTVPPQAGYIAVGQTIFRGSAQAAGVSNGWVCTTAGWLVKGAWTTGTVYAAGVMVTNAGNVYQATAAGTSGATAPTHSSGDVSDGVVTWRFVAVGTAAAVKALPAIAA